MMKAKVTVDSRFAAGEIDRRIFSGFIEHLGRAVYEGIYDPSHPSADENGFRQDVIELVRELDMPLTRYPGGNFVSSYNWEDGVGPKEKRPVRPDLAWKAIEPNTFGTDEFIRWCRAAGTEPMLAVNLGTRGVEAARNLVEYCNFPGGTYYSDLRKANGSDEPHKVKYWCLGNEMDGPWQVGHKTAEEYGKLAAETAKAMKLVDNSIELTLCGSSSLFMDTFGTWELETLKHAAEYIDYVSLHIYFENRRRDMARFLASGDVLEKYIRQAATLCDAAAAIKKIDRKIMLSLDEWNVWYRQGGDGSPETEWTVARPLLEERYDMADVLVNGTLLNAMLNCCDRLKMACIAQTVNVIAPIVAEKNGRAWKQTIFYPQYYTSRYARGKALDQLIECPVYDTLYGWKDTPLHNVRYLSCTTVYNEKERELVFFAVNRNLNEPVELTLEVATAVPASVIEAVKIANPDLNAVNSAEAENVKPEIMKDFSLSGDTLSAVLAPASWNMIRIKC